MSSRWRKLDRRLGRHEREDHRQGVVSVELWMQLVLKTSLSSSIMFKSTSVRRSALSSWTWPSQHKRHSCRRCPKPDLSDVFDVLGLSTDAGVGYWRCCWLTRRCRQAGRRRWSFAGRNLRCSLLFLSWEVSQREPGVVLYCSGDAADEETDSVCEVRIK